MIRPLFTFQTMEQRLILRQRRLPVPVLAAVALAGLVFVPLALISVVPALVLLCFSLVAGVGVLLSAWALVEGLALLERWIERDVRFHR